MNPKPELRSFITALKRLLSKSTADKDAFEIKYYKSNQTKKRNNIMRRIKQV
jgi:hypothetical protein